jgi:hypothetical protein
MNNGMVSSVDEVGSIGGSLGSMVGRGMGMKLIAVGIGISLTGKWLWKWLIKG